MSMTLMYEDQDAADNSEWNLQYQMGFWFIKTYKVRQEINTSH
jgi:hypothetical protein